MGTRNPLDILKLLLVIITKVSSPSMYFGQPCHLWLTNLFWIISFYNPPQYLGHSHHLVIS